MHTVVIVTIDVLLSLQISVQCNWKHKLQMHLNSQTFLELYQWELANILNYNQFLAIGFFINLHV